MTLRPHHPIDHENIAQAEIKAEVHTATDENDLRSPHSFTKKIERLIYFLAYRPCFFPYFFSAYIGLHTF